VSQLLQDMTRRFNWASDGTPIHPEAFVGRRLVGTIIRAKPLNKSSWEFIFETDLMGSGVERRYRMACPISSLVEAQGLRYRYTFTGVQENPTNVGTKGKVEITVSVGRSRMSISARRIPVDRALQEDAQMRGNIRRELEKNDLL
jgi:hypothetical protein